jgi:hypothetical protein
MPEERPDKATQRAAALDRRPRASRFLKAVARFGTSAIALPVYALVAWLEHAHNGIYYNLLTYMDGEANHAPFMDLSSILRAGFCWRHGVNVYAPNGCMNAGMYNYAPLLLRAAYFGFSPDQSAIIGVIIEIAFLCSLSLLPASQTPWEFCYRTAAVVSATTLFALDRANFDIVIFMLILFGLSCLRQRPVFAYVIFLFGAALKFYPIFLLALAARERLRGIAIISLLTAAVAGLCIAFTGQETATAVQVIPHVNPFGSEAFSSDDIPVGLHLLLSPPQSASDQFLRYYLDPSNSAALAPSFIGAARLTAAIIGLLAGAAGIRHFQTAVNAVDEERRIYMLAGMFLICGCFFAAENAGYRAIFLYLSLPGLYCIFRGAPGHARLRLRAILCLTMLVFWGGTVENGGAWIIGSTFGPAAGRSFGAMSWLIVQLAWWWIIVQFVSIILAFFKTRLLALPSPSACPAPRPN